MRFGATRVRYVSGSMSTSTYCVPIGGAKVDRHAHAKRRRRHDDEQLIAVAKDPRLGRDPAHARLGSGRQADRVDRVGEDVGAAVLDRNLAAVDVDQRVVDAAAEQRREQMFDRRDAMLADAEHRRAGRIDDVVRARRELDRIVEPKAQSVAGRGGENANARRRAGMETDAFEFDRVAQRRLVLQAFARSRSALLERVDPGVQFRQAPDVRL